MAATVKIASQLPEEIHERYFALQHGQKQRAIAAGFLMYFGSDEKTQWAFRHWAKAITDGRATMQRPPEEVREYVKKWRVRSPKQRKKRGP